MTLWEPGDPAVEPPEAPSEQTWTVAEVGGAILAGLRKAFPGEIWVRGEIRGYRKPNATGHSYFNLAEPGAAPGERPDALVSVALFRGSRSRVDAALRDTTGASAMADGVEVRIRAKVDWWIPGGQLRLIMSDIDPVFTLGRLDEQRRQLLEALAAEGLLDANAQVPMPLLPLRVGLITSAGSAAHADFVHELERSGYAFRIVLIDARVQGVDAPSSVVSALDRMAASDVDVIALVRGGGATTDLAAFDHGDIARAIAAASVPVLTGIGHEIDRSVADEVAHLASKTPTAAASALVAIVAQVEVELDERRARTLRAAERQLAASRQHLERTTRGVGRAARVATARAEATLQVRADRVLRSARSSTSHATTRFDEHAARITRLATLRLATPRVDADARHQRLRELGARSLGRASERLEARSAQVRAHDPARAMARGWSFTHGPDGRVLRDVTTLAAGDQIVTVLANGSVRSTVDAVDPAPKDAHTAGPDADQSAPERPQ